MFISNNRVKTLVKHQRVSKNYENDCRSNPILKQTEAKNYLEKFQQKFILVPHDKVSKNVTITCKKY